MALLHLPGSHGSKLCLLISALLSAGAHPTWQDPGVKSKWSASSSLDVSGRAWGGTAAGTWNWAGGGLLPAPFGLSPLSSPLDMASILIPLLLLLLLLLVAGVVFWYKRRVRG